MESTLASNSNYMNVIRESHESILRRKNLMEEKRRILNMDFRKASHRQDWERLNKYLLEKTTQCSSVYSPTTDVTPKQANP